MSDMACPVAKECTPNKATAGNVPAVAALREGQSLYSPHALATMELISRERMPLGSSGASVRPA